VSRKKLQSPTLDRDNRYLGVTEETRDFEEFVVKEYLKELTLQEKVEEAKKPLYLKRYE
jgi:hypothetical protein